jgi:hypothetical protein
LWTGDVTFGKSSTVDEKKVEEIVQRFAQQNNTAGSSVSSGDFNITAMIYASESATLKVVGKAPNNQQLMWVWTASTQTRSKQTTSMSTATAAAQSNPIWDGPLVLQPGVGGMFSVEVNVALMSGVVEVRLEQGKAVSVARYDLNKRTQLE